MLFLLVLLLVAGWNVSPLSAAATVTVIPLAALAGARLGGDPRTRAAAGCAFVGGGVLALAWLPNASLWWTVIPQALAGVGMGLALTALGGDLLPERTPATRPGCWRCATPASRRSSPSPRRSPPTSSTLDADGQGARRGARARRAAATTGQDQARPALLEGVDSEQPRAGLKRAVAAERHNFTGADRAAYDDLGQSADDMLVTAVGEAFRSSFLLAGAAGLLAAALLAAGAQLAAMAAATALSLGTPAAYFALHKAIAPAPPAIQDPCRPHRTPPNTGGVSGFIQEQALKLLDSTACKLGSSREELVLALADKDEASASSASTGSTRARRRAFCRRYSSSGPRSDSRPGARPTVKKSVNAPIRR